MGVVANKYLSIIANELIKEGYNLIKTAYQNRDYNNRTFNLHDSYGSCVFLNGKEYPNSRRYVGREALVGKRDIGGNLILGRAEIDDYFNNYKAKPKGLELVVAVAIFYGEILEKSGGKLKKKYKVISGAYTQAESLAAKYGGKVTKIGL